ncbi:hypothetical protein Tco_0347665 [Tanacetum coccineum]
MDFVASYPVVKFFLDAANELQFLTNTHEAHLCNCGPKESGIEDFSCCVVSTVMSTGGTIMASHEDVMGFFAKNTTSNNLIRTDFKQKGIFPEIMLHFQRDARCGNAIPLGERLYQKLKSLDIDDWPGAGENPRSSARSGDSENFHEFQAKRSSFSRTISTLFTIEGYEAPRPLLRRFNFTTGVMEFEVIYENASGGDCISNSPFGLAMVLLGREPKLIVESLVRFYYFVFDTPKLDELGAWLSWVLINPGLIHWGLLVNLGSLDFDPGYSHSLRGFGSCIIDLLLAWLLCCHGWKPAGTDFGLHRCADGVVRDNYDYEWAPPQQHREILRRWKRLRTYFSNNGFASGVTNFGLALDDA